MSNRILAAGLAGAMAFTGLPLCNGWQASAEARFDCCAGSACVHAGSTDDIRVQEQADACCATAESSEQGATTRMSAAQVVLPALSPMAIVSAPRLERQTWIAAEPPIGVISPPRYLLLSVFLI